MNTDMSRRQFVGLAGSLATVLGLGLVGCGGGAGKGSAAGSAAAKDVKGAAESKKLVVGFDKSYPRTALWAMTASTRALTLTLPRPLPISRLGCRLRGHRLGCQGHAAQLRRHQLHLERLYHGGP